MNKPCEMCDGTGTDRDRGGFCLACGGKGREPQGPRRPDEDSAVWDDTLMREQLGDA